MRLTRRTCGGLVGALFVVGFALASVPEVAAQAAANRPFQGIHFGVEAGIQHLIGGSLVDGIDTLQEDSRVVASLFAGARGQFGPVVAGVEVGVGRMDGDLDLVEAARELAVEYRGDSQWHWMVAAGPTLGPNLHVFAYLSEVTRNFDVTVRIFDGIFRQTDEQGLLRFGLGAEAVVWGPIHMRAMLGSSRADFGDRETNIEIDPRVEASVGVLFQL